MAACRPSCHPQMRFVVLLTCLAAALRLTVGCVAASEVHHHHHHHYAISIANIVVQLGSGSIVFNESSLSGLGQSVAVDWSEITSLGNATDFIAAYNPQPDDWTQVYPVKYVSVTSDDSGSGESILFLLNMRTSYTIAYFTGDFDNPILVAVSDPLDFDSYDIPMQIHLAYSSDPTEMVVQWTTAQNSTQTLNYGLAADNLNNTIGDDDVFTTSYTADDMCGDPANSTGWHDPGFMQSAVVVNLQPNTEYFYQIVDVDTQTQSDILSFYSAPVPSASTEVDFLIFGDLGQVEVDGSSEADQMVGSILSTVAMQADLSDSKLDKKRSATVFHIGDIAYANGFAPMWEQFFYQIANLSTSLPWMTTDGNHEVSLQGVFRNTHICSVCSSDELFLFPFSSHSSDRFSRHGFVFQRLRFRW